MDVQCSDCGFDFPDTLLIDTKSDPKSGFAHSPLADVSLIIGGIAAGFGCVGAIVSGIVALASGQFWNALFVAPVTFFLCFAMLVVYIRIQHV